MRILVVDDEAHLRTMMRLTLEAAGYEVVEAADGEEGLALFGDGGQFDATLLDQRMPGIDGLETLRRMKQLRPDAPVLMVTAYATIDLAVDAMKLGARDFVRKPMTPETLRQAVAAALARHERVAPPPAPAEPASVEARGPLLPLEVWTTNGFFVRWVSGQPSPGDAPAFDHHFVVRRGRDEAGTDVVVVIDQKVQEATARQSGRQLQPSGTFWRKQAESALVNWLWSEAELPDDGRLVIRRATGAVVDAAVDWTGD